MRSGPSSFHLPLVDAIGARRLVSFRYHGLVRIVEPHTYGLLGGREQLLAYQIGGESRSGGLPEWRRFDVEAIVELRVRDERFGPRAPAGGQHAAWDVILAFVPSPP